MSTATACELPRAAEVARARAQLAEAHGHPEHVAAQGDLTWALRDRCIAVALDPVLRARVAGLAEAGDEEAAEALVAADALDPEVLAPPTSAMGEGRQHVGGHAFDDDTAAVVRRRLRISKAAGQSFGEAWERALVGLDPSWLRALRAGSAAWRSAYEESEPPRGLALLPFADPDDEPGRRVSGVRHRPRELVAKRTATFQV